MSKRKNKRSLFSTVICMLLCASMMFGSTYAWFSDTVENNANVIVAGKLDVKMYHGDSATSLEEVTDETGPIFDYTLWEPGYTDVEYIKIENAGNLALEYTLQMSANEEATNGKKLSEVIDVYFGETEEAVSSLDDLKKVGTLAELLANKEGAAYGILLPDISKGSTDTTLDEKDKEIAKTGSATYCIALHMQESADNDYQNLKIGDGIAVKLYATQYTHENDSFDNTYDEGTNAIGLHADVTENGPQTISATIGMGGDPKKFDLDTSFTFKATDSYEEAQQSPYRYWHADFVVSVDKDVAAESMALAGYYKAYCDDYNDGNWVALMSEEDIEADTEIRLLELMLNGGSMSYQELCNWVPEFKCGAVDLGDNTGTTLTVELRLYEVKENAASTEAETGKYITIGTYEYTF